MSDAAGAMCQTCGSTTMNGSAANESTGTPPAVAGPACSALHVTRMTSTKTAGSGGRRPGGRMASRSGRRRAGTPNIGHTGANASAAGWSRWRWRRGCRSMAGPRCTDPGAAQVRRPATGRRGRVGPGRSGAVSAGDTAVIADRPWQRWRDKWYADAAGRRLGKGRNT